MLKVLAAGSVGATILWAYNTYSVYPQPLFLLGGATTLCHLIAVFAFWRASYHSDHPS